jgi:hypothetical protein
VTVIRALCAALVVAGAAIYAAPVAGAESACVLAGQTPQYCSDKFLESIHSAFPVEKHDVAVNLGFQAVNLLLKHPNKKQYQRIVSDIMRGNPDLSAQQVVFFVQMAVHWFGPPGFEDQIDAMMTA